MPTVWQLSLLPASWRGIPFGVRSSGTRSGRRGPDHEYPARDIPWPEDLGKTARRLTFSGFVIGDDAGAQAIALLAACERKGPGELVHPIYGSMQMQLRALETEERWDQGRVIEFRFQFVEAGQILYPTAPSTDTQAQTKAAANDAVAPISNDYGASAANAANGGFNAVRSGTGPTQIPPGTANADPRAGQLIEGP